MTEPSVTEKLTSFSQKLQVSLPELQSLFDDTRKKIDAGTYGAFPDDKTKDQYGLAIVWGNFVGRPPTADYAVIPVAFEPKSISKGGSARASIFALVASQGNPDWVAKNIACTGEAADLVYTVGLFQQYPVVKLARFAKSDDLFADNRTKFENAQFTDGLDPVAIYQQYFKAPYITIDQCPQKPSAVESATGFPVRKDFRIIRGIITRKGGGTRDNGSKWANYVIIDDTVQNETKVSADGRVIYPGLTVWCDPTLQKYNVSDQCDFVGNVVANKTGTGKERKPDGTYTLNAFAIVPVHFDVTKQTS